MLPAPEFQSADPEFQSADLEFHKLGSGVSKC